MSYFAYWNNREQKINSYALRNTTGKDCDLCNKKEAPLISLLTGYPNIT